MRRHVFLFQVAAGDDGIASRVADGTTVASESVQGTPAVRQVRG